MWWNAEKGDQLDWWLSTVAEGGRRASLRVSNYFSTPKSVTEADRIRTLRSLAHAHAHGLCSLPWRCVENLTPRCRAAERADTTADSTPSSRLGKSINIHYVRLVQKSQTLVMGPAQTMRGLFVHLVNYSISVDGSGERARAARKGSTAITVGYCTNDFCFCFLHQTRLPN